MFKIRISIISFIIVSTISAQQKKWTLKDCIDHALQYNISVKQAENKLLINKQNIIAAKGQFLPSVSGSLGQRMSIGSGFDPVSNQRINNQTINSFNYNVSVNQTIFNGFKTLNLYKQSVLNKVIDSLELARIRDDISLNVVNAYLNVLFNKENLEIAIAQYDLTEKQLKQVEYFVSAGVQPKANIFDTQATLSRDAQQVTIAQNNLDLALLSLSQLLQVEYNGFDISTENIVNPDSKLLYSSINPILDFAFKNRSEIKLAEKNIESVELNTKILTSGYLPTINFSYGYGSVWSESKNDFIKQAFFRELDLLKGHNFNLTVSLPIFSRFQNKTSIARTRVEVESSKLNLNQAKLNLESNIQRAFTDTKAAFKAFEAAKKVFIAQNISFSNAQERYNNGTINTYELEQVRVQLINANVSLVNAKYDFVFKTKVLNFYMGVPLAI